MINPCQIYLSIRGEEGEKLILKEELVVLEENEQALVFFEHLVGLCKNQVLEMAMQLGIDAGERLRVKKPMVRVTIKNGAVIGIDAGAEATARFILIDDRDRGKVDVWKASETGETFFIEGEPPPAVAKFLAEEK